MGLARRNKRIQGGITLTPSFLSSRLQPSHPHSFISAHSVTPPQSSPSSLTASHSTRPHTSRSHTPSHCLTPHAVMLRLTLLSPSHMVVAPLTDSLSPTLTASLSLSRHSRSHQILQSPADVFPYDNLCPSLSCTCRRGAYVI